MKCYSSPPPPPQFGEAVMLTWNHTWIWVLSSPLKSCDLGQLNFLVPTFLMATVGRIRVTHRVAGLAQWTRVHDSTWKWCCITGSYGLVVICLGSSQTPLPSRSLWKTPANRNAKGKSFLVRCEVWLMDLRMLMFQVSRAAWAAQRKGVPGLLFPWEVPWAVGRELATREVFPSISCGLSLRKWDDSCFWVTRRRYQPSELPLGALRITLATKIPALGALNIFFILMIYPVM